MVDAFEAKAKDKGRCVSFPGYCKKSLTTCEYAHPIVNCSKYPQCTLKKCTYLHPVCEYDCLLKKCPHSSCTKYHPWRDSYRKRYDKMPEDGNDELAVLKDAPEIQDLLDRFDNCQPHDYSSAAAPIAAHRPSNSSSNYASVSPPPIGGPMTSKTQPFSTRDNLGLEISEIHRRILEEGIDVKDFLFTTGKCTNCRYEVADQLLIPCHHLTLCFSCREESLDRECHLCGKFWDTWLDYRP